MPKLSLRISERRMLLLGGDAFLLCVAGLVSLWGWSAIRPDIHLTRTFIDKVVWWPAVLMVAWLIIGTLNGIYDLRLAARVRDIIWRLTTTAIVLGLLYLLVFFFINTRGAPGDPFADTGWQLPRVIPALFLLFSLMLTLVWRMFYALVLTGSNFRRRVLIVGAGYAGNVIAEVVRANLQSSYEIVGFVDDDPDKQGRSLFGVSVMGTSDDLTRIAMEQNIDELVLSITHELGNKMFSAVMNCYVRGVSLVPMPLLHELATGKVPVEHIGNQWYISLPTYPTTTVRLSDLLQRIGDVLFSVLGLLGLIFSLPLISLVLYLDSHGPIFYSQVRTGRNGKPFKLYKFRSMVPNAEKDGKAVWAKEDDPRITRFGKFMRRTRLDELPQLWNVLKGDMSVIGPRPERPEFIAELEREIPFYDVRHLVRPGLTGWAQVNYHYGNTKEDALIKLQYDLYYIKHRSPLLNLLILWKTVSVVLKFQGT